MVLAFPHIQGSFMGEEAWSLFVRAGSWKTYSYAGRAIEDGAIWHWTLAAKSWCIQTRKPAGTEIYIVLIGSSPSSPASQFDF